MSAMVDQDILFRAGLMLAVLVIAGLFGSGLARLKDEREDNRLSDLSNSLGSLILQIYLAGPGSSAMIDLGSRAENELTSIGIDEASVPRGTTLGILPGMVVLENNGQKEIVISGSWIIPSRPPLLGDVKTSEKMRNISMNCGGYQVSLPILIKIERWGGADDPVLFIFPTTEAGNDTMEMMEDMKSAIEGSPILTPGWSVHFELSMENVHAVSDGVILLKMSGEVLVDGVCPIPLLISRSFILISYDGDNTMEDLLYIDRETISGPNGDLTLDQTIRFPIFR